MSDLGHCWPLLPLTLLIFFVVCTTLGIFFSDHLVNPLPDSLRRTSCFLSFCSWSISHHDDGAALGFGIKTWKMKGLLYRNKKKDAWDCRGGSAIESTYCSYRGPEFSFYFLPRQFTATCDSGAWGFNALLSVSTPQIIKNNAAWVSHLSLSSSSASCTAPHPTPPPAWFDMLNFLPHQRKWGAIPGAATTNRAMVSSWVQESRHLGPSHKRGSPNQTEPQ